MARREMTLRTRLGRAVGVAVGSGISTAAGWYFRGRLLRAAARAAPGLALRTLMHSGHHAPRAPGRFWAPAGKLAERCIPEWLRLPDGR